MSESIKKSIFWLTLSEIIFNVSGYIIHSALGRILGPEDYGRYALVITFTTIVIILIGKGVPTAMSKYISEIYDTHPGHIHAIKKRSIQLQLMIMGVITLAFFLLAPVIAMALGDASLTALFRLSSLIIPAFAAASFYFSFFTGLHEFKIQAILKTVRGIARLILIVALAYFFSIEGSVVGYILAPLVVFLTAIGLDILYYKNAPWKKTDPAYTFAWKKLANFAWPIILFMLFYELFITIDLFLVKRLLHNDTLTGIYNAAITIGRIPYFLFYAITIVIFPTISNSTATNDKEKTRSVISETLRFQLMTLIPSAALMIVFAPSLVALFYGQDYLDATAPLIWLIISALCLTIFYIFSFALNGAGKIRSMMLLAAGGLLLNIFGSFLLIPKLHLTGAAISSLVSSLSIMVIILMLLREHFNTSFPWMFFLKVLFATTLITIPATFIPQHPFLFIIWSLALFSVYGILLYFFKALRTQDIQMITKIFNRTKTK